MSSLKLMPEAEQVYKELKGKYARFNDAFRKDELWVYKQSDKKFSEFTLKHYVNTIDELITEKIIRKENNQYILSKLDKESFKKIITEEKELIERVSCLCFGEPEISIIEALDLVLLGLTDKNEYLEQIMKAPSGNLMWLKDYGLIQYLSSDSLTIKEINNKTMIRSLERNNKYLNKHKRIIEKNQSY